MPDIKLTKKEQKIIDAIRNGVIPEDRVLLKDRPRTVERPILGPRQNGWVVKSGVRKDRWTGFWYEYKPAQNGLRSRLRRKMSLGFVRDMNEREARLALQQVMVSRGCTIVAMNAALQPSTAQIVIDAEQARNLPLNLGAIGELVVAADLLAKGYSVYRSLSPTAPCDLVAEIGGQFLRVEVKVADKNGNGFYARSLRLKAGKYDMLAVLSKVTGAIHYEGLTREGGRVTAGKLEDPATGVPADQTQRN